MPSTTERQAPQPVPAPHFAATDSGHEAPLRIARRTSEQVTALQWQTIIETIPDIENNFQFRSGQE